MVSGIGFRWTCTRVRTRSNGFVNMQDAHPADSAAPHWVTV